MTDTLSEGEIAPPTREVLAEQTNALVLLGEVVVDPPRTPVRHERCTTDLVAIYGASDDVEQHTGQTTPERTQ